MIEVNFNLTGKVALVTGSTRGIGRAMAEALASQGARVAINGRNAEDTQVAVDEIHAAGFDATGLVFDVTDPDATDASLAELERNAGPVDILVNNAGIQLRKPLKDWTDAEFESIIAANLTSCFRLSRMVSRSMIERQSGNIINIGSITAFVARPTIHAYVAAKSGLHGLTRSLAAELGPHGVRVNAIAPGFFTTGLNKALVDDPEFTRWVENNTPAGRWGRVEELAGAVAFLASDAASYVNGHILVVDGGTSVTL